MTSKVFKSSNFILAAGGVLFRKSPQTGTLQFCVLYNRKSETWVLPKGRKDSGESLEAAALREAFEETGYKCESLPCRIPTRASIYGANTKQSIITIEDDSVEPFAITVRNLGSDSVKIISWYLMRVISNAAEKIPDTQMATEDFESHFFDTQEAIQLLAIQEYRDIALQAVELVQSYIREKNIDSLDSLFNP